MRRSIAVLATCLVSLSARGELVNFDLMGKLYTKWLYRNNGSQGVLTKGNPFWPDNIQGDNGVGSEFELGIRGRVGQHVEAGVRVASRFGALWQDWWENGDIKDAEDTSGESLGMNHAQYIKLRGYWIRAQLPIPFVDEIIVGSSDLGMFNEWTIGRVRYIDRDNGKGIFIQGAFDPDWLRFNVAAIALPKLFVGPGWSTGVGDPLVRNPFYSQDWAYGVKLESDPAPGVRLTVIGTLTRDAEVDRTDPDAEATLYPKCEDELGAPVAGCKNDGAVDTFNRYSNGVLTGEAKIDAWSGGSFDVLGGYSYSRIDKQLAGNGVHDNGGNFPLPYDDVHGGFVRARGELFDLGIGGLSAKVEYFFIDEHFTTVFGQRREGDVLLTDGFIEGGQLPTLNLANEFVDFDEPWYESVVGWHGGTLLLDYGGDVVDFGLEGTFISYDTNGQFRDVDFVYPTFLHSEGYSDTDLDGYVNDDDHGRDPRSVYRRHQDRRSVIGMARVLLRTGAGRGLDVGLKAKLIWDNDKRCNDSRCAGGQEKLSFDDYDGLILRGKAWVAYPLFEGLTVQLGTAFDWWRENNRLAPPDLGDDVTIKVRPWLDMRYEFEGLAFHYYLEYLYKDAERERLEDRTYHIIRSKASMEVAW